MPEIVDDGRLGQLVNPLMIEMLKCNRYVYHGSHGMPCSVYYDKRMRLL